MPKTHVVVDGSNIATEGRTFPSLKQLESALVELRKEMPKAEVTVVVDATFAHRIDPSERKHFEEAQTKGGYITPPAGAIGRGDAFILKIAEKVNAVVLSNDSFQEFHGEHAWLFEPGRLLGASPVPGIGWIFVPRTPVRGPKSRGAVRGVRNLPPMPEPKTPPPRKAKKIVEETVVVPVKKERASRIKVERKPVASPEPVNDPTTFITFIASHPLGEQIEAEVESFTSHGAIIRFENVQCYAPLSGLGSPPPRSPREVLERGERRTFVIRGLDPQRRGIELALPEVVQKTDIMTSVDDAPSTEEQVLEIPVKRSVLKDLHPEKALPKRDLAKKLSASKSAVGKSSAKRAAVAKSAPKRAISNALTTKKVAPKKVAPKKAAAESLPEKKAAVVAKSAPKRGADEEMAPPKKVAPKKTATKKVAAKKAVAKKAVAKRTVLQKTGPQTPAKGASSTKAPAKKTSQTSTSTKSRTAKSTATRAQR